MSGISVPQSPAAQRLKEITHRNNGATIGQTQLPQFDRSSDDSNNGVDTALPLNTELLGLIHQQDSVMADLMSQLNICKAELDKMREQCKFGFQESKDLYSELKQQISSVANVPFPVAGGVENAEAAAAGPSRSACKRCAERLHNLVELQDDKQLLEQQLRQSKFNNDLLQDKCKEAFAKVRNAIQAAEQTTAIKTKFENDLREAERRLVSISEEKDQLIVRNRRDLSIALEDSENNQKYQIKELRLEVERLKESENRLQCQNDRLENHKSDMQSEINELKKHIKKDQTDLLEQLTTLRENLNCAIRDKLTCDERASRLESQLQNETLAKEKQAELFEMRQTELTRQLEEFRTNFVDSKAIAVRLEEKNANLSKDLRLLEINNVQLDKERKEMLFFKETEFNQLLKGEELKNVQERNNLESLLASQNSLISKLRTECKSITDTFQIEMKQHRKEVKQLKKKQVELKQSQFIMAEQLSGQQNMTSGL